MRVEILVGVQDVSRLLITDKFKIFERKSYPVLIKPSSTLHLRAELLINLFTHLKNVDLQQWKKEKKCDALS